MRRHVGFRAVLALAALSACGGGQQGIPGAGQAQQWLAPTLNAAPGEAEALVAAGAPQMIVRMIDRGDETAVILAGERDGVKRWRGLDNAQIYTREGLIIGTRGLGDDLMTADIADIGATIRAVAADRAPRQAERLHRRLDGEEHMVIEAYVCDITFERTEAIDIPGAGHVATLLLREACLSPFRNFINFHWIADGGIVRSRQFIGSGPGRAEILFLP